MSSNLIRIFVNNQKLFTLSKFTTIHLFKQEIKKNVYNNLDNTNIILKHNNKILQNNNTLYYYDIKDNDNIDVILPLRGGDYNSIEKTTKRLKFAYIPLWILTYIFFISGIPVILSIILTTYFKKQFKNPFVKFIIQLAQLIIFFWIVLIMVTIICIPFYSFFSKTKCKIFKDSTSNSWYGALIFLLCYILIFFFDIFNIFTITEGQLESGLAKKAIDTTEKIYNNIKETQNTLLLKILLSVNPYTRILDEGIGYFYDTIRVIGNIKMKQLGMIKRWLMLDEYEFEKLMTSDNPKLLKLIRSDPSQEGGTYKNEELSNENFMNEELKNILLDSVHIKNTIRQEDKRSIVNTLDNAFKNYPTMIKVIQDFLNFIVHNITKKKLQLSLQVGVPLSILVLCFTFVKILWDLIWGLFT
jgi:ABC-type multidrug transport system fused ATPase/permease subunit